MENDTYISLGEFIPDWQSIDPSTRDQIAANTKTVNLADESFVFRAGDLCDGFLILASGTVRVQMLSASGREATLYRVQRGGSCILTTSCLLSSEQYPAEAITESKVTALAISRPAFEAALESSTGFRRSVFDGFSSRLASVISKIEEIAFTSIDVRMAAFLLRQDPQALGGLTHQRIANEVGTVREVVSRTLKRFEKRGWVALGRGRIRVLDRPALRALEETL